MPSFSLSGSQFWSVRETTPALLGFSQSVKILDFIYDIMCFTFFLLFQLMFEGSLEQQKGFIAIAAPYFTNGYCSAEPQEAAKKGKNFSITLKTEDKTNKEARFSVSTPIY